MVDFVYNTEVDMIECAMWWELPEPGAGGDQAVQEADRGEVRRDQGGDGGNPQSDQSDTLRYLGTR